MKQTLFLLLSLIVLNCNNDREFSRNKKITYIEFTQVKVNDNFWGPAQELNRLVTIPHNLEKCEEMGIIRNFEVAGNLIEGSYTGLMNWDEFLYKAVEAASYALMQKYDSTLDQKLDEIISKIAAAQEPDGYLRTYKTILLRNSSTSNTTPPRWKNLQWDLELYCSGHLLEAAIAHKKATGKDNLFRVAVKNINLIDSIFGPEKLRGVPGHQEIEPALMKMYEFTGDKKYLNLCKFFIDERGNASGHELYGDFQQDHLPFIKQSAATGQAPRATYLYSGAADVAFYNGDFEYMHSFK
ncbi:MAG: hypothetical protein HC906_09615 [Bacteroidales bacterium]|nr:hypothetical protein [Bacteroidales bacterium]